jgi:N-acetylneuraminate synthase
MDYLFNEYQGGIHISLGMISGSEKEELFEFLFKRSEDDIGRIVLYHCTSEYPCPFENLYLLEIAKLTNRVPENVAVGYSNHGYGIATDIAAYILGARWVERHFVDDRALRHTDAAASLEPDGLRRLCRDLKAVHRSMSEKSGVTPEEMLQRKKLRSKDG